MIWKTNAKPADTTIEQTTYNSNDLKWRIWFKGDDSISANNSRTSFVQMSKHVPYDCLEQEKVLYNKGKEALSFKKKKLSVEI